MKRLLSLMILIGLVFFAAGAFAMDEPAKAASQGEGQDYLVTDEVVVGETDAGDIVAVEEEDVTPIPPEIEKELMGTEQK